MIEDLTTYKEWRYPYEKTPCGEIDEFTVISDLPEEFITKEEMEI